MHVFVYGTLTEPDRVASLVDSFAFVGPAVLEGLHAVEGRYPTLVPGGRVGGRLLRTEEIGRLDKYEGVDRGLYVRVTVPVDPEVGRTGRAPTERAAVYVGDPDQLDADAAWPGTGSLRERIEEYIETEDVRLRISPDGTY